MCVKEGLCGVGVWGEVLAQGGEQGLIRVCEVREGRDVVLVVDGIDYLGHDQVGYVLDVLREFQESNCFIILVNF
mgnify:CR=1 FL=1